MNKYEVEPVARYLPGEGGCDSQFRDHETVKSCTGNPWVGWQPLCDHHQLVMLLGLLDDCLNSMRNAYPDYDHYESSAYISATAALADYRKQGAKYD